MSIAVADNFSYQGVKPLDARFQFNTVASMKAAIESTLYDGCFAYVTATKKYYSYDSSNSVDTTLGRWREYESGGASTLSDLTDISISSPSNGQVLTYNGSNWANVAIPSDNTKQNKTLDTPLTIGGSSRTSVESAMGALTSAVTPVLFTGAGTSSGTISKGDIVAAGSSKTIYWIWPAGSSYGSPGPGFPLPFGWSYAQAAITYLVNITKNSDDTYIEYVAYAYFTYDSKTYSKIFTRVATKSGSTWTFPSWTDATDVTVPMLGTINRSDIYDTTEKVVGKWTDGKPIYQKVLTITSGITAGGASLFSHGISNLDTLVSAECWGYLNGIGGWQMFPSGTTDASTDVSSGKYGTLFSGIYKSNAPTNANKVCVYIGSGFVGTNSFTKLNFIFRYTKTTDAANSYNYADENDYSESEKIVGKWINGKTVYQKTFNADVPNVSSDGESNTVYYSVGSNVDMFVSLSGVFTTNAGNTFPFERMAQLPSGLPGYGVTIGGISNSGTANKNTVFILNTKQTYSGTSAYVTAQYTKV